MTRYPLKVEVHAVLRMSPCVQCVAASLYKEVGACVCVKRYDVKVSEAILSSIDGALDLRVGARTHTVIYCTLNIHGEKLGILGVDVLVKRRRYL